MQSLIDLCSACGVAVAFVPELPRTRVSGATRWVTAKKALIQFVEELGKDIALNNNPVRARQLIKNLILNEGKNRKKKWKRQKTHEKIILTKGLLLGLAGIVTIFFG